MSGLCASGSCPRASVSGRVSVKSWSLTLAVLMGHDDAVSSKRRRSDQYPDRQGVAQALRRADARST